jgi:integrase
MGSVFRQKGKGKSRNWTIQYYAHGKPVVESSGTADWKEARGILAAKETAIANGEPVVRTGGQHAYRFEDGTRAVLNDYRLKNRRSVSKVQRMITLHLEPRFGGRKLIDITADEIEQYALDRLAGTATCVSTRKGRRVRASHGTVNRELACLRRMFVLGMRNKRIGSRPPFPKLDEKKTIRKGFFEYDHFVAVAKHLPACLVAPAEFAYITGWRIQSEVLTLQWTQIDTRARVIRLFISKNDEGRVVPYGKHPRLVALIEEQERIRDAFARDGRIVPWVFPDDGNVLDRFIPERVGQPLFYVCKQEQDRVTMIGYARQTWKAACVAAGVPGKIPHDFRRTAVRNMVRAGIPEKIAMEITGHKTRTVFDRYNIVNEADLANALEQLSSAAPASTPKRARLTRIK